MKVAFFLLHYPVFSETFVSKEILNLQKLNVDGQIFCEKINHQPPFHPHLKQIKFPVFQITTKIIGPDLLKIIVSHLYYIFHQPFAYLKSIFLLFSFFNYHHLRVFIKAPLLAKELTKNNIDLIYVHEVDSPSLFALICSQLCHLPCGIIIHTQYLFAQNKYLAQKIKNASFIIFQSQYSLNESKKITKLSKKYFSNCHVLSTPGIDTKFFQPPLIQKYPHQIKIVSIGRLEEAKGYPILLKAIKKLHSHYPDIQLTIIGNGSQKNSLEKYLHQNKLQKNVHLLGSIPHSPHLIKLLHQHQYFILPSILDSQKNHDVHPNVVQEAMSTGLISITSNLGGITEIIKDSQNAFLIKKVNPTNIAQIIIKIHSLSKSQKQKISLSAHNTILKEHHQKYICSQLKKIFISHLNEK